MLLIRSDKPELFVGLLLKKVAYTLTRNHPIVQQVFCQFLKSAR